MPMSANERRELPIYTSIMAYQTRPEAEFASLLPQKMTSSYIQFDSVNLMLDIGKEVKSRRPCMFAPFFLISRLKNIIDLDKNRKQICWQVVIARPNVIMTRRSDCLLFGAGFRGL